MISVRRVRAGEAELLRELRLRALSDSPTAFASRAEEEAQRPASQWTELAAQSERADALAIFVAVQDERWMGIAAGRWFDRERAIVQLWGMWVDPEVRACGVGGQLEAAVRDWAAAVGAGFVRLGVIEGEASPGGFYERLGFVRTGEAMRLTRDPSIEAYFLARPV